MQQQVSGNSLDQALHVLDEAADESAEEIKNLLKRDYRRLRRAVVDIAPELKGTIQELKEKSAETLGHARDNAARFSKETAKTVDRKAHESPWPFVAAAAVATGILGFWLGRRST